MAQFNPKEIIYHYRNGKPVYYSYDEELYCGTFPEDWAKNHLPGTGPKECLNCAFYGSWNGVFLGYCANCSDYEYNGERGRGLLSMGEEDNSISVAYYPSIFETYLKDVSPDDVGDTDFMDSVALVNAENHDYWVPPNERYSNIDEANDCYDELFCRENKEEINDNEIGIGVGYTIDRGGYYGGDCEEGYDSY